MYFTLEEKGRTADFKNATGSVAASSRTHGLREQGCPEKRCSAAPAPAAEDKQALLEQDF